jgi:hypothetical protein
MVAPGGFAPRRLKEVAMFAFRRSLIGECWRKMNIMKAEFEQSESGGGLQSPKVGAERIRDEQASSRMDDEGCPNARPTPDSRRRKPTIVLVTK